MFTLYLLIFLTGLIFGSFYNVVGLRIPAKESIVAPRSACPACGHTLTPLELIPVVSYVFQGGKCRQCKTGISPLYPIMELTTALLFLAAPMLLGWTAELFVAWALISLLVIIFISDLTYMLIPNKILLFFTVVFLFIRVFIPFDPWWGGIAGAIVGFGIPLLIAIVSKGGMGGGDIKLFALIGFVMGIKGVILAFLFSAFFGAFFGVIGMMLGLVKRCKPIPFGPFIVIGTLVAYFFGDHLLDWYIQFL